MSYRNKDEQRAYQREWCRRRRAVWLSEHGPCVRCGSEEELEVDHIDPERKVSHRIWSWSEKRRDIELSKCQVLCRECHDKKHCSQAKHGTTTMYRYGCRCVDCSASNTQRARNRRLTNSPSIVQPSVLLPKWSTQ